jgi:hypothetical protein
VLIRPQLDAPAPDAPPRAPAIGRLPNSTRLLVSGSAETGEYLVEGVASDGRGAWYLLVEVPTPCGTDMAAYKWEIK